jgi:predicted transcriptional regulator
MDKIKEIHLRVQEQLEKSQQYIKLGMTNIGRITNSMLETRCGFTSARNNCKEKQRNSSPLDMDHLISLSSE